MAAILNSAILNLAILDSAILHKTLTQTISIWLKLIHSDSTWWWQPSWILPSWIQTLPSWIQTPCYLLSDSLKKHFSSTLNLTQTNSIWLTWWWQPSWILPSWIQPFCTKIWLKLFQSDSNSFILTQLDDGSHLELCHHGFTHFSQRYFTHSFWLNLMMAAILESAILDFPLKLTHTYQDWFPPFAQKKLHWFILTHIGDGSHLEFDHHWFIHFSMSSQTHSHLPRLVPSICLCTKKNFTHSFWLILVMADILNSAMLDSDTAILDSDTLFSFLRFTQNPSHSTLTLTQTNSIWLKLIHSHLTWWWQPSWILPSWIQTRCFLLWDSLKNTLSQLWLWLKLINLTQPHSFSLNLMMAAILNSAMLESDTVILHSDT